MVLSRVARHRADGIEPKQFDMPLCLHAYAHSIATFCNFDLLRIAAPLIFCCLAAVSTMPPRMSTKHRLVLGKFALVAALVVRLRTYRPISLWPWLRLLLCVSASPLYLSTVLLCTSHYLSTLFLCVTANTVTDVDTIHAGAAACVVGAHCRGDSGCRVASGRSISHAAVRRSSWHQDKKHGNGSAPEEASPALPRPHSQHGFNTEILAQKNRVRAE